MAQKPPFCFIIHNPHIYGLVLLFTTTTNYENSHIHTFLFYRTCHLCIGKRIHIPPRINGYSERNSAAHHLHLGFLDISNLLSFRPHHRTILDITYYRCYHLGWIFLACGHALPVFDYTTGRHCTPFQLRFSLDGKNVRQHYPLHSPMDAGRSSLACFPYYYRRTYQCYMYKN